MNSQSPIFLISDSGSLTKLSNKPYDSEDLLQSLIQSHPSLLAGELFSDPPRRWLFIEREAGIPDSEQGGNRWSIDHVFLDQDGIPTLIEVKRSSDTRIRREVVGQMLDYAANVAAFWPVERLVDGFQKTCEEKGLDPEVVLAAHLSVDMQDLDTEGFWKRVQTNLEAGKLRLLFVADSIPRELQRIVEFLNSQMDTTEVLAIELSQYVGSGQQTVVPRIYGKTSRAERAKSVGAKNTVWDKDLFLSRLAEQATERDAEATKSLLDWGDAFFRDSEWGRGDSWGNRHLATIVGETRLQPISLQTFGKAQLQIKKCRNALPKHLQHYVESWVSDLALVFGEDVLNWREPAYPLGPVSDKLELLKSSTENLVNSVREATQKV